jgi:hypothetical protein
MGEKSIESLQLELYYKSIVKKLLAGETRGKIASDLNKTPSSLLTLLHSDEFLEVLKQSDEELAEDLLQEKLEGENKAYEDVIEDGASKAAKHLVAIIGGDASGNTASVAAAKAVIELAERISKKGQDRQGQTLNLPKRQYDMLKTSLGEAFE